MIKIWRGCSLLFLLLALSQFCGSEDRFGNSDLLFKAVLKNDVKMVQELLTKGISANIGNDINMTPLSLAVRLGRKELSALLLEAGADPNVQSKMKILIKEEGMTPLLWAAEYGDAQTLELMIGKGGDVNKTSLAGDSSLIYASRNGWMDIVELLLENGASLNYKNPFTENTALVEAVLAGHSHIMQYLVDKGADVAYRDQYGNTLIMLAASRAHLVEVMYLLERGLKINTRNKNGDTALHLSIGDFAKRLYTQEYLISSGLSVDAQNEAGITALMEAAYRGYPKSVGLLLRMGADIDRVDKEGNTALHFVAKGFGNHEAVARELLQKGAECDAKNKEGNTALIIASREANLSLVSTILDFGADVNIQNDYGWSSLMEAAKIGRLPIVKLLIENKAYLDLINKDGKTAADIASEYKQSQVYEYLKKSK